MSLAPKSHKTRYSPFHTNRRVILFFFFILMISSGFLLTLHLKTDSLARSDTLPPSSSTPFSSSSSDSLLHWTPDALKNGRPWTRSRTETESNDDNKALLDYKIPFRYMSRPRVSLPHHNTYNDETEQVLLQQQLQLQDEQLRRLRREILGQQTQQRQLQHIQEDYQNDNYNLPLFPLASVDASSQEYDQNLQLDNSKRNTRPFEDTLMRTNSTLYLTYFPYGGIINQFYSMLRGMEIAKALNRTLIIPPITSSSHDRSKQNQPWSTFLDLKRFSKLTGTKAIELHELRDIKLVDYNSLRCHITCESGSRCDINSTAKSFLRQWRLNATLSSLQTDDWQLGTIVSMLQPYRSDKYICLSNAYMVAIPGETEWERFGRHLHFTDDFEDFAQKYLIQHLAKNDILKGGSVTYKDTSPIRHRFIVVHVPREDPAKYCQSHFSGSKMAHCPPSTTQIAEQIHHVQKRLNPSMNPAKLLPVFVVTTERDPVKFGKFIERGWKLLDHDTTGTVERYGYFGPTMLDQVLMANAGVLVGVQTSAISRVGALRQQYWFGRSVVYI